jgi:hypothetical protein
LVTMFAHAQGRGGSWLDVSGMTLRPSVGGVGVYDAVVGVGPTGARTGIPTKTTVCGGVSIAAVLRPK